MWRCIERATLPGMVRHWLVRKAWIEREWRASAAQGFTQLVVLGAGLDTLGVRIASEGAAVRVIELDHPATQELKREGLGMAPGVVLAPCKLGEQRVSEVLGGLAGDEGFDPARPTMVISEGVLMYLSEGEVEALLQDLMSLPVARLRLVVSAMNNRGGGSVFMGQRRVVGWWLARRSEPFRSGTTPELLRRELARVGLTSIECIDVSAADPGGGRQPPLQGELLARGERGGRIAPHMCSH
jgi:methyltransferase (TIGR00027 family)